MPWRGYYLLPQCQSDESLQRLEHVGREVERECRAETRSFCTVRAMTGLEMETGVGEVGSERGSRQGEGARVK